MSQPKSQLETFKAWAGKDSDISYYLNSHHVDINASMIPDWRPFKVTASGSRGTATDLGCAEGTEDTITLLVDWVKNDDPAKIGTAVYTASWTAPQKAGVHSNQYFHCNIPPFTSLQIQSECVHANWLLLKDMASQGEIRANQAKRGYDVTDDNLGALAWYNPYVPRPSRSILEV